MNPRERQLVAGCDEFRIPVEGVARDANYMITVDRNSKLPTRDELGWLHAYRSFKEDQEYSPREIETMYWKAIQSDGYPVMPPQKCGLWTYRFVKYDEGDWAYTSHGWATGGSVPRPPWLRRHLAAAGERFAGPFTLRELLDMVTGHIDQDTGRPIPGRNWADWVAAHGSLATPG